MRRVQGSPLPLGVEIQRGRVNFSVVVPAGKTCQLLVYKKGDTEVLSSFTMPENEAEGEVRFLALKGMEQGEYEYQYEINGKTLVDPYAVRVCEQQMKGIGKKDEKRGVVYVDSFAWDGDKRPCVSLHDVIAYSIHVRGFTRDVSSKVKKGGTFAGVMEKLPYLRDLGINQIQCMPVYEFEKYTGKFLNYWGYGHGHYFAPKESYSAAENSMRELKELVKCCHKEGIELVLEMPFESAVLPQTALDCLRYYMLEYHVDGFVLNPYHVPWDTMVADPLLKGIKLLKKSDAFQNTMRRFLKGDESMVNDVMWALKHHTKEDGCCNYITGQTGFTLLDLVSYDTKHNEANGESNLDGPNYNYSWNCGAEGPSRKRGITELRKKQMKNAFSLLLLSQGTPCLLAGDEFGNSQGGNNNVYCQDNETSWLNWNKLKNKDSLFEFVQKLIALRKSHPLLHRAQPLQELDQMSCGIPDVSFHGESAWQVPNEVSSRQLGVFYSGSGQKDNDCFAAYNMHWIKHKFALPALSAKKKWYCVLDTSQNGGCDAERLLEDQKSMDVQERSIVFLIAK